MTKRFLSKVTLSEIREKNFTVFVISCPDEGEVAPVQIEMDAVDVPGNGEGRTLNKYRKCFIGVLELF